MRGVDDNIPVNTKMTCSIITEDTTIMSHTSIVVNVVIADGRIIVLGTRVNGSGIH